MNTKPRALDLFCKAGGVTRGLQMAGFHVTGVDIEAQPRYCGDAFVQADALTFPLEGFDFIWASPPCQGYSRMRHLPWLKGRDYPLLIDPVRERLEKAGVPYVIENVEDSPLRGITLCGTMFGLKVYRHRVFESSHLLLQPTHPKHREVIGSGRMLNDRQRPNGNGWVSLPSKGTLNNNYHSDGVMTVGGHNFRLAPACEAMGIDWMNRKELAQAIPPAYSHFLGRQIMQIVAAARAA